jgi:saccharopine dehydrogenase-like NADP-dependent oxidoreductase
MNISKAQNISIAIMGDGRIARACAWFLRKAGWARIVDLVAPGADLRGYSLLIGALAGEIGEKCLDGALAYGINLIDISDVDPPGYLKRLAQINKKGITVIPGCGFSPGLVNCILGREFSRLNCVRDVEVCAGSLSSCSRFYPFLWCFEDIVLEHRIPSQQILAGKRRTCPAFDGQRKEKFFGIDAESYYCASGFENVLEKTRCRGRGPRNPRRKWKRRDAPVRSFTVRVVRPEGFRQFFGFMENQGLLKKENFQATKKVLESEKRDNITFARIIISAKTGKRTWLLKATSRRNEELNSMQKITASVPAVMAKLLSDGCIGARGLLFMEDLARHAGAFSALLKGVAKEGITIRHD